MYEHNKSRIKSANKLKVALFITLSIMCEVKQLLTKKFDISHSTLEIECEACGFLGKCGV